MNATKRSSFAPSIPSRPRSRRGTSGSWGRSGRRTIGPRRGRSSERRKRRVRSRNIHKRGISGRLWIADIRFVGAALTRYSFRIRSGTAARRLAVRVVGAMADYVESDLPQGDQPSAAVIKNTDQGTLMGFIHSRTEKGAKVYTDEARGYASLPNHETVKHSVAEYVRGQAHTNGIESFWSMLEAGPLRNLPLDERQALRSLCE